MPLFEVAVIEHPTQKEKLEGSEAERLVLKPVAVVAKDEKSAIATAVAENAGVFAGHDSSRLEVVVRPFVGK